MVSKQQQVIIKRLTVVDSENVSNVHLEAFPEYFLAQFNPVFLKTYYSYLIRCNPYSVGAWKNNKLVGFIVGGICISDAQEKFFMQKIVLVASSIVLAFLKSGVVRKGLYKRIGTFGPIYLHKFLSFFKRMILCDSSVRYGTKVGHNTDCSLLSIAVVPDVLGKGVASQMVEHFEKKLIEIGIYSYELTVIKSNKRAIAFYLKHGMKIEKEDESLHFRKDLRNPEAKGFDVGFAKNL